MDVPYAVQAKHNAMAPTHVVRLAPPPQGIMLSAVGSIVHVCSSMVARWIVTDHLVGHGLIEPQKWQRVSRGDKASGVTGCTMVTDNVSLRASQSVGILRRGVSRAAISNGMDRPKAFGMKFAFAITMFAGDTVLLACVVSTF